MVKNHYRRIGVFYGGFSSEREISIKSGIAVANALRKIGYDVIECDVTSSALDGFLKNIDAAFICLHGKFGEDGGIQEIFEANNIPYTGSGPAASYVCMDKIATKRLLSTYKIKTPPYRIVNMHTPVDIAKNFAKELGFPVIIKPQKEGSSIGVSICYDAESLIDGLCTALEYQDFAIIEKYISGDEITVGIIGGKPLPVIQIKPHREIFSYEAKYKDPDTEYIIEPNQLKEHSIRIQRVALKAYNVLGCRGFARVDMIYSEDHQIYVLEINTIPGLTERSLLPKAANASGINFPNLCHRILRLCKREV